MSAEKKNWGRLVQFVLNQLTLLPFQFGETSAQRAGSRVIKCPIIPVIYLVRVDFLLINSWVGKNKINNKMNGKDFVAQNVLSGTNENIFLK